MPTKKKAGGKKKTVRGRRLADMLRNSPVFFLDDKPPGVHPSDTHLLPDEARYATHRGDDQWTDAAIWIHDHRMGPCPKCLELERATPW
jgi:hypothetical protein